jgi:hypothetical protein
MQPTRSRASFSLPSISSRKGDTVRSIRTRSGTEFCSCVSAEDLQEEQGKPGVNPRGRESCMWETYVVRRLHSLRNDLAFNVDGLISVALGIGDVR